ncbi:MAG TPA: MtnX-like HAD-IB family phosphatase [candidate division Zixibacteria bacterium]|nr:MtnX-like HAD-IB family phosphatase [candidate division Zixibacteria bacterium]
MKTAVFCDFDGTVCRRDVGATLFKKFSGGRTDVLIPLWKDGTISTRECLRHEASMVTLDKQELYQFLDEFQLNPGFDRFYELCRAGGVDIYVISDGFGFYIDYILKRFGYGELEVITNHGQLVDGVLTIEFPWKNRRCRRCGTCKGERIAEWRERQNGENRVAFVGDGYSDLCALAESDLVFAKKDLEQYCLQNNIDHIVFDDFDDVIHHLQGRQWLPETN